MKEQRLSELLHATPVPPEARERTLDVLRQAYSERERVSWPRRHARGLALAAAALAVAGAVASPPGRAVVDHVRKSIGVERSRPALFSLPAPGRLLVTSSAGSWVVSSDGSKRLLGPYREASWSPFGRFVVAARPNELAAVDPRGHVRWTLDRPAARLPRWGGTPTDTRIAYVSRRQLRVVAGDGTGDRLLGRDAAPVAPAWRPGGGFVLAFVRAGRVVVLDTATGRRLWQHRVGVVLSLAWSGRGDRLLVRGSRSLLVLDAAGHSRFALAPSQAVAPIEAAALSPDGRALAFAQRADGRSELRVISTLAPGAAEARRVFSGQGTFTGLEWSPNGRWLLVAWPEADQWLFLRSAGIRAVRGVSQVSAQFEGSFPVLEGWCCAAR